MRVEQQTKFFVEDEQRRLFAACDRRHGEMMEIRDLPVPAGPRISVLDPSRRRRPAAVELLMPLDSRHRSNRRDVPRPPDAGRHSLRRW